VGFLVNRMNSGRQVSLCCTTMYEMYRMRSSFHSYGRFYFFMLLEQTLHVNMLFPMLPKENRDTPYNLGGFTHYILLIFNLWT